MISFSDNSFFLSQNSLSECIDQELVQFNLHQCVSFNEYVRDRLKFLKSQPNAELNAEYLGKFRPTIAVFAGSFNPFHKGHYNVLQKAEKIFDKVIIAFGRNPEKDGRSYPIPNSVRNRQIEEYNGLLTDFIGSLGHDVIVIRGLRNSTDFQYEQNQYRYIQELMPGIKIVNIFCDKEFEHISSSGIRTLEKFNKHKAYLLD
jgi:pantetheine-phosphate adenylyltransferase